MSDFYVTGRLLARNTLLNLIGQAVPLFVAVATVPFIVRGLGTERFGLLSLAWVILGYFSIFDLGLGRATTKFVAKALSKGEEKEIPCLVWTSVTAQAILGVVGAVVLIEITPLLAERILKIPQELIGEAKATFYLLAFSVPVVLVSSSFRGVLEAAQRFDLVNAVSAPSSTLTFLLPLVGLLLGLSLPGIVALILMARIGALSAFITLNLRITPQLKRYSGSFSLFPRLFSFGGWVTVSSIAAPVFTYLERFLIGSFLSVGAFAFYAAPYEIISRVVIIPVSLSTTLFPTFSYFDISNCKGIKELLSRPFKYLLFIMVPILIIFIVLANGILKLWLGDEFAQNSTIVFQVLAATFFFHTFAYLPFTAVHGLGRPDLKAKFDLIMLPTFVGLCWWFILKLGLVGAALAKLLITVMDVLYLSWKAKCLLKLPIREMFGERAGKAVIIASLFTIAVFSLRMPFKSILADIAILGGLIPAYMFLFVTTAMDDKDRSALRRIKAIFEDRKA